ncbi:protein of unknown function (plasmid) [Cupriavidus neocaledonicus]|uniref:Uncharacterized protein n=1 Tax=Cupriavidus neocaledonicus TaxID=1040979 RepID=A0A375HNW6_9BURK|nr:hypothetical protein CBM2605_B100409 [Cupriavidus neocaledonicus]SPD59951.1 protein of unknown function [Cupriavidus neocaledonicus]
MQRKIVEAQGFARLDFGSFRGAA